MGINDKTKGINQGWEEKHINITFVYLLFRSKN